MKTKLPLFFLLAFSTNFFGQIGFDEKIVTGYSYTTLWPQVVKTADLDGDGDLDVIAYGTGLNWYENVDGLGNFGEKKIIAAEISSSSDQNQILYTADFDNDGDIDVMCARDNKISVYENSDGLGTFTVMQLFTLGSSYPALSTLPIDMNADGDMDLLVFYINNSTSPTQRYLCWFENDGTGNFGAQQIINNNAGNLIYGSHLFADDMDGDGDPDIILGYNNVNKIGWFKNNGNGTFNAPVIISTTAGGIKSLTTADVDNDGDKDIVAAQSTDNQAVWYKNLDGLGNFSDENVFTSNATATKAVLIADINNDNLNDVVYTGTNEIGWIANSGSGNFGSTQVITNKAYDVRDVTMADLDGDGIKDLISASYADDKVAWYKNMNGSGTFGRQVVIGRYSHSVNNVYPGDFDGDNDVDLLVNSQNDAKLTWFENVNGLGFYGKEHIITEEVDVGNYTPIAYPSDIDGDGDLDIAVRKDALLFWYENDGQGNFNTQHPIDTTSLATIIRSADMDGDGKMDLICGVYNADKISWYKNLGSGNFGTEQVIAEDSGTNGALTSLEIADMDGDDDMDIIASSYDWTVWYYKNTNGAGAFSIVNNFQFDGMIGIYPADIDGDGDKDIVGVSSLGGGSFEAVVWYENTTGLGNFDLQHPISTLSIHGESIHAVDIDNDGDIDVVTGGGTTTEPQFVLYTNNGDGTFAERQVIQNLLNLTEGECVSSADVDNDGDMDILAVANYWANSSMGKVSVFENLGNLGNTIQGRVTIDSDSNGCTNSDLKGSNLMVISDNGTHSFATFTDQNGAYHVATTAGNFTTAITSELPDYFASNPASYNFNFTGMNTIGTGNFCVAPIGVVNDLTVSLYPSQNNPRPGFNTHYRIVYRNNGTTTQSGSINFEYNNTKINFVLATQTVSSQTAGTLSFAFANLNPFETRTIDLTFAIFPIPTTHINDVLVANVAIVGLSAIDVTPGNNSHTLNQTVIAAYDPNDIMCLEGNQVLIEDADKFLHYIIRFQNTGTADAINVKVENTLDSKLDWTSLQLESTSHIGRVEINDGSEVKFIFNNINLPAATTNEPRSQGFIAYKIKPRNNVVVGDIVNSTADIFFDFNPAIITNTTATQFVDMLSVPLSDFTKFNIYPNPTNSLLNIEGNTMIDNVMLIDINGRILKEFHFNNPTLSTQLDVADLTTGVYFLKIKSGEGITNKKIIKRQ